MSDIFVNYRSADARFGAAATYELLANRFDRTRIFLDNQSIGPGGDYPDRLRAALESMRVLLVLIGPRWLATDPRSPDRLLIHDEQDWVRQEISRAFERSVRVVPILLDGSPLPDAAILPDVIRQLVSCQAVQVSHLRLGADIDQLADQLAELVPGLGPAKARLVPVPRQLPSAPPWFVGRERELGELSAAADGVTSTVLVGIGGIGKTWLALHWAHRHASLFPDGQLFVDLRGSSPGGRPMSVPTAMRCLLDALGVDHRTIPVDVAAQTGRYRSLVAGRRMLIVLDNAENTAQVTALLPGSPTCTVLITSRNRMDGLLASVGARRVTVGTLADAEARTLFERRLGRRRVTAEPAAVADLLRYCCGLPLALGIVASQVVDQDGLPLAVPATELRDAATRVGMLDSGDAATSLTAVLSWSYDALSATEARVFCQLGLVTGPDIGLPAVRALTALTALTALPAADARAVMRALERMSLVQQSSPGRWTMHSLVRLYAADRAAELLSEVDRDAAVRRVVDHYLHSAWAADRLLVPHRQVVELGPPADGAMPVAVADQVAAMSWFTAEYACVRAAQDLAVARGWHLAVWRLAWVQHSFQWQCGHLRHQVASWRAALDAALALENPGACMLAHRLLGSATTRIGRPDDALAHLHRALELAAATGDRRSEADTHRVLARTCGRRGDHDRALVHAVAALEGYRGLGSSAHEADALDLVCWCAAELGRYDVAFEHGTAALALYRDMGDSGGEATALDSLGYLAQRTGRYERALECYRQALGLFRGTNPYHEANTLERVGEVHALLAQAKQARAAWQRCRAQFRSQGRVEDTERVQRRLSGGVSA
ncbi:MAG TPA: tetratricopeptide repeat protein [Pseudonocardiaceae bacterium]|nr:tetratricopeptide repeat protein [Pseudonocardiaceae bacterium]